MARPVLVIDNTPGGPRKGTLGIVRWRHLTFAHLGPVLAVEWRDGAYYTILQDHVIPTNPHVDWENIPTTRQFP